MRNQIVSKRTPLKYGARQGRISKSSLIKIRLFWRRLMVSLRHDIYRAICNIWVLCLGQFWANPVVILLSFKLPPRPHSHLMNPPFCNLSGLTLLLLQRQITFQRKVQETTIEKQQRSISHPLSKENCFLATSSSCHFAFLMVILRGSYFNRIAIRNPWMVIYTTPSLQNLQSLHKLDVSIH